MLYVLTTSIEKPKVKIIFKSYYIFDGFVFHGDKTTSTVIDRGEQQGLIARFISQSSIFFYKNNIRL